MNKRLLIPILILLVTIGLTGCSTQNTNNNQDNHTTNPELNKFVGTWTNITYEIIQNYPTIKNTTYTFFLNGTFREGRNTGNYELKEGKLFLDLGQENGILYDYNFSNNNQTLTLTQTYNQLARYVFTKK